MIIILLSRVNCVSFIVILINADIQINQTTVVLPTKLRDVDIQCKSISLKNICLHIYTEKIKINVKTIIKSIAMS